MSVLGKSLWCTVTQCTVFFFDLLQEQQFGINRRKMGIILFSIGCCVYNCQRKARCTVKMNE